MTEKFFVDTNILLYAGSRATEDRSKHDVARELLAHPNIALSAQVMQEFYAVATTKQRLGMTHDEALAVLQSLTDFPVCPITRELVMEAVELRQRYQNGMVMLDGAADLPDGTPVTVDQPQAGERPRRAPLRRGIPPCAGDPARRASSGRRTASGERGTGGLTAVVRHSTVLPGIFETVPWSKRTAPMVEHVLS
jgi:predicted nucleic acid-binding protein